MPKKIQPEFKIRTDTGGPESLFAEEQNDLKLEKLTQKVTIISILVPVLIGIVLVISYLDIKSRVSTVQDSGESGVQSLSKNLESRFSSLSVKFAALEENFAQEIRKAAKTRQSLQARLKEAEKSVRWLSKIKAGKKNFMNRSAEIDANLTAIRSDLQTVDSNLNSLDQSVKKELVDLVALVEKSENSILVFQAQFADKIDRTEAQNIIADRHKEIQSRLEAMGLRLEKQIVLNRQRIAAVKEKAVGKKPATQTKSHPKQTKAPEPTPKQAVKPTSGKPEVPAEPAPQPGEIVEQDL